MRRFICCLVWRWGVIPTLQSPTCECELRHLCNQQVQSSHTITVDSLARPKEFESPTFRLGGGRSILLSYGRISFLNLYNIQYLRRFVNGLYFHIADLYFTDFEGFRLAIRF